MDHSPKAPILFLLPMLLAAVCFSDGCAPRKLAVDAFVGMVQNGISAVEREDDLHLLAQSMPANIKLLETLLANDPGNRDLLVLLARMYGGYAFAIVETEQEARRLGQPSTVAPELPGQSLEQATARYYQRGCDYALRALETRYPQARIQLERDYTADTFFAALGRSDVPALFWYGFNLGGYIQHSLDSVAAIAKAHLVEKSMQRVVALDETYYHGSAHLGLLAYYGSRPPMMGGSPEKARRHWERYQQLAPDTQALGRLYLARYVLVRDRNRGEFVRCLAAIAGQPDKQTAASLLDKVAAVRAGIYLSAVDAFFD